MKPFNIKVDDEYDYNNNDVMEDKKQFLNLLSDESNNPLSLNGLKYLSNEELLSRYVEIDNGAARTKWHICWLLRQRFDADQVFGQYIKDFEKIAQTNCLGNQKNVWRAWRAGEFCEKYGIGELSEFNLSKSVVYELSAPANESVAEHILSTLKTQNGRMPIDAVRRLIEQSKAVATQELPNNLIEVQDVEFEVQVEHLPLYQESESDKAIEKIVEVIKMYQDIVSIDALIRKLQSLGWN